jgi:hypothetical protein
MNPTLVILLLYLGVGYRAQAQKESTTASEPSVSNTVIRSEPVTFGKWSLTVYGTFNRALPSLSGEWVDTEKGVGMDWGVGGGVQMQWPLLRWVSIGLTTDYAQWQVQRRFFEANILKFSSDQTMSRVALMATVRFYPYRNLFIQPMGGWQVIQVSHAFSDMYPGKSGNRKIQVFGPAFGGVIGYEFRWTRLLSSIGVHYQLTSNGLHKTLEGSFHYIGVQAGIGWQPK